MTRLELITNYNIRLTQELRHILMQSWAAKHVDSTTETSVLYTKKMRITPPEWRQLLSQFFKHEPSAEQHRLLSRAFEYFCCIQQTRNSTEKYYMWDELDPDFKERFGLPSRDEGMDACTESDAPQLVQVKYYGDTSVINQSKLGGLFMFQHKVNSVLFQEKFSRTQAELSKTVLCRTDSCRVTRNVKDCIDLDCAYSETDFQNYCLERVQETPQQCTDSTPTVSTNTLRDYQKEAVNTILQTPKNNVVLNLPTGSGKSIIMFSAMERILADKPEAQFLILVPTRVLMEQFKECACSTFRHLFPTKKSVECIKGAPYSGLERLTVCCYESYCKVEAKLSPDKFEKIFIDEAHHIKVPALYQNSLLYEHPDTDSETDFDSDQEEEEALSNPRKRKKQSTKSRHLRQYSVCISKLAEHRNTVWASATIDEIPTFRYYSNHCEQ